MISYHRQLLKTLVELKSCGRACNTIQSVQLYSSKPQEHNNNNNDNSEPEVIKVINHPVKNVVTNNHNYSSQASNPFGLKDEGSVKEIIHGIYVIPPKPKKYSFEKTTSHSQSNADQDQHQDNNRYNSHPNENQDNSEERRGIERFSKYGYRSRHEKRMEEDITAEKVFCANFGEVRFDNDNVVKVDGQYDEDFFNPEQDVEKPLSPRKYEALARKALIDVKSRGLKTEAEVQTEESNKIKATKDQSTAKSSSSGKESSSSQETKKTQVGDDGEEYFKIEPKTVKDYIKLTKLATRMEDLDMHAKIAGNKEVVVPKSVIKTDPITHVPKVYAKPRLNDVTHEDVWFFLQKQICFENDFLVALNKPAGIAVHSSSAECRHTIIDFLPELAAHCNVEQVYPCHRLDKDTTGVLLLAKSEQAASAIKHKFANRTMIKQYLAICKNVPELFEGTIKIPIGEGKIPKTDNFRAVLKPDLQKYNVTTMQRDCQEAITKFKVVSSQEDCSFIEAYPQTGITHQVRVHLAHALGCPIFGDHKYSHREKMAPQRLSPVVLHKMKVKQSKVRHLPLHLHCSKLEFIMPDGFLSTPRWKEPIFVHAKLPNYFKHTLRVLKLK